MPRMRTPPRRQVARTFNVPSPIKGLNTRDSIAAMDPYSAITLTNFIPRSFGCAVRQGYRAHQVGITGYVESLLPYTGKTTASNKLFAAAGDSIYDVTATGGTPSVVQTGLTSAYWQSVNFTSVGGHYLAACNGTNPARLYNGTTWTSFTQVVTPTAPGEVNVDPSKWVHVAVHQRRLWFVEVNSTKVHYLPVDSVGGTVGTIDFGALFPHGGYLQAVSSWSLDAGAGMDDYFIGISSTGDVAVFQGADPSTASTFSLVGVFYVGSPVGRRCLVQYAGDVLAITRDGILPLSKGLMSSRVNSQIAFSDAIQQTISDLTETYSSLPGWELCLYPAQNLLILNVPQINRDETFQLSMSTLLSSWSQFQGIPAQCFAVWNDRLYFGGNGAVFHGLTGYRDNANADGTAGNVYQARAQQAFHQFNSPTLQKRYTMARVTLSSAAVNPAVRIGCSTDYKFVETTTNLLAGTQGGAAWDTSLWDDALWSGSLNTRGTWQTITGIGYNASITLIIAVQAETYWTSTDWAYEVG